MNQEVFQFLRKKTQTIFQTNSLIISAYFKHNGLVCKTNKFLRKYLVSNNEVDELIGFFSRVENPINLESLIELFEFVISPVDKEVNGAVYTPKHIRDFIVKETLDGYNIDELKRLAVGDIACGCGGFFYTVSQLIREKTKQSYYKIFKNNIYGLDIEEYSIERTKILLSVLALENGEDKNLTFNLFVGNALSFDWSEESKNIKKNDGFDVIVGNPPYVGASKMDLETKELIKKWSVSSVGKSDLYIPFFQIGMDNLKADGKLGYITVNTFYRSLNGRGIRNYFSENQFSLKIIDFGGEQVFKGRTTYTCICLLQKNTGKIEYVSVNSSNLKNSNVIKKVIELSYSELNTDNGWRLGSKRERQNISKIESTGTSLGKIVSIRNGFATLSNKTYLFRPEDETDQYYFFTQNQIQYKIEKEVCRDAIKPNTLKSEAQINKHKEKIIFPYHATEDKQKTVFDLPSLKINPYKEVEFKEKFPNTYKYLLSQKDVLDNRDKGKRKYEEWFIYGRSQALAYYGKKLLFPYIAEYPYFTYCSNETLLFYNGYAVISQNEPLLLVLSKLLQSDLFWYYIQVTSKPYENGYYALAKNYVKGFGIYIFKKEEEEYILAEDNWEKLNSFFEKKYNIKVPLEYRIIRNKTGKMEHDNVKYSSVA